MTKKTARSNRQRDVSQAARAHASAVDNLLQATSEWSAASGTKRVRAAVSGRWRDRLTRFTKMRDAREALLAALHTESGTWGELCARVIDANDPSQGLVSL